MCENNVQAVQLFKALADETRFAIVGMLLGGELCACKILENFDITQPTLSYHMKLLTDCGLVSGRRDGAWMRYSLNAEALSSVEKLILGWRRSLLKEPDQTCCEIC
jgi:ArsR family transcriptional regulator